MRNWFFKKTGKIQHFKKKVFNIPSPSGPDSDSGPEPDPKPDL